MRNIKVYISDSHVLVRQMMINILRTMQDVTPQGATSGTDEEGLFYTLQNDRPDLLLFGIQQIDSKEMSLYRKIRAEYPDLPVIVITPKNREGGLVALEALKLGAADFITIPDKKVNIPNARVHFLKRVVPAIRMVPRFNKPIIAGSIHPEEDTSAGKSRYPETEQETVIETAETAENRPTHRLTVVGGGAGGIQSLLTLLRSLPIAIPAPLLALQHIPAPYTQHLAREMSDATRIPVEILKGRTILRENRIYLIPGGFHASIDKIGDRIEVYLHRGPRENRCRPSLDVLLRSAARSVGRQSIAVILSGGGTDGVEGSRALKRSGGRLFVESKKSALLWDLPGKIARNGWHDGIYPATVLGREIVSQQWARTDRNAAAG